MRKNVGTIDATIRITMGLLGLAYGIGRMAQRPSRTPWLLMAMSAMKVAEGATRYCPMLGALGISTRKGMDIQPSREADTKQQTLPTPANEQKPKFDENLIARTFIEQLQEATDESPKQERNAEEKKQEVEPFQPSFS